MTQQPPSPLRLDRQQLIALRSALLGLAGLGGYAALALVVYYLQEAWQLQAVALAALGLCLPAAIGVWLAWRGRAATGVLLAAGSFVLAGLSAGLLVRGQGVTLLLALPVIAGAMVARLVPARVAWLTAAAGLAAGLLALALDVRPLAPLGFRAPLLGQAAAVLFGLLALAYAALVLRLLADISLRAKLVIAFLGVALVPLAALTALNERNARQALEAAANQALLGAAEQTALSLDTFVANTKGIIQTEAQNPAIRDYLRLAPEERRGSAPASTVRALLPIWQLRDTRARSYMLLDASGVVLLSTFTLDVGTDFSQADFFVQAQTTGQTYVSNVQFEPGAEQGDLYFSKDVRDTGFRLLGVLVARYNARVIQDLLEPTNGLAGPESFGAVFDENQVYLAHGLDPLAVFKLVGPATPERLAALRAQRRLPTELASGASAGLAELAQGLAQAEAQPVFSAPAAAAGAGLHQVAITGLQNQPWQVAFFQPRAVFLAPVEAQTRAAVLLAALIAVVVAGVAVAAAQVLADPITRLTRVAEQVSGGDLAAAAEVDSRDEIGILGTTFNSMTDRLRVLVSSLESRVAERTAQLQAAADISRATASVRDLDELLRLALALIRDRFGFYHASIFLLDEAGRQAVLRESTGAVGAQLKARRHQLAVGSRSLIGWVTANRQPRVALDVGEDPFHFKNPLLPDTRSELAIPLMVGDQLLGALNVQSTQPNAFGPGDVQVLQTLADQLSVAIQNAQLFARTEANLQELRTLYQRLTGENWRSLLRGQTRETVYQALPDPAGPADAGEIVQVPLVLRDQQLGVIELHGRRVDEYGSEERAALGSIAAQVASALESAALLEETQRRRLREQLINDISNQMRASLNSAAVLQTGIRELGRTLGASEVVVVLGDGSASAPAAAAANGNGHAGAEAQP